MTQYDSLGKKGKIPENSEIGQLFVAFTGMSLERDGLTCERQLRKVTGPRNRRGWKRITQVLKVRKNLERNPQGRHTLSARVTAKIKHCFWFMVCFFGPVIYGISAPWGGIEPTHPALEGGILTTGPPRKFQREWFFIQFTRKHQLMPLDKLT